MKASQRRALLLCIAGAVLLASMSCGRKSPVTMSLLCQTTVELPAVWVRKHMEVKEGVQTTTVSTDAGDTITVVSLPAHKVPFARQIETL